LSDITEIQTTPALHPPLSIAVLLTNFNTWEIARRCVEACFAQDRGRFASIHVYDDCSTVEPTVAFPAGTQLHRGQTNLGLTKALNAAFKLVKEDIVVLFDSDAYPTTPFCDEIREMFTRDPDLGLVALRTVGAGGRATQSYATEPNVWTLLLGQALYAKLDRWLHDRSGRIAVFTCAMAVRKTAFDDLHGFDEAFDWLDLDIDFGMRMNRSRWKVAVAANARIFHEGGGAPQLMRNRVARYYKNRWYLLKKFHRIRLPRLVKMLILIRLYFEFAILRLAGVFLFPDPAVRHDKLTGRRELIRLCAETF
jgi:GT2 family glycosyltransferase